MSDPPPVTPELTAFLVLVSQRYPQQFYKPIFTCAASNKEKTVAEQLRILDALALHVPAFWTTDSEMMAVALMSDVGSAKAKDSAESGKGLVWGTARIGQCVVLLELIGSIRKLVELKSEASSNSVSFKAIAVRTVNSHHDYHA